MGSMNCAMSAVNLRRAVPDDRDAILAMIARFSRDVPGNPPAPGRSHLEKDQLIIAECGGRLVGHLSWRVGVARPPHIAVRYGEITTICVERGYRGQTIARDLCETFLVERTRLAISLIRVGRSLDRASIALLESLEF